MFDLSIYKKTHLIHNLKSNKKSFWVIGISFIVLIVLMIISVGGSTKFIQPFTIIQQWKIVFQLIISGFALGVGGYLIQRLTKNRLADTSLTGMGNINLLFLTGILLFIDIEKIKNQQNIEYILPIIYFLGAFIICLFIQYLCTSSQGYVFKRIIISGIIINLLTIIIAQSLRILMTKDSSIYLREIMLGDIDTRNDFTFYFSLALVLLALIWIFLISNKYRIMVIDQAISKQLGISNKSITFQIFICIAMLVSASYALSGNIAFVGIVAANIAFSVNKNKIKLAVIHSGFIGSIVLLLTYILIVVILDFSTSQVLVLTPLISGPYFLYKVIRLKS